MRIILSLLVLICGLQQIFARSISGYTWPGSDFYRMRPYMSIHYDDYDLFGEPKTINEEDYFEDFKKLTQVGDDSDEIFAKTTENIEDLIDYDDYKYFSDLQKNYDNDNDDKDNKNENTEERSDKTFATTTENNGLMVELTNTDDNIDITKSSEETKNIDEDIDIKKLEALAKIFDDDYNTFTHANNADRILKVIDELLKELEKDDNSIDDKETNNDDGVTVNEEDLETSSQGFPKNELKDLDETYTEIDEFIRELEIDDNSNEDKKTSDDDSLNEKHSKFTQAFFNELDELFKELELDDNLNKVIEKNDSDRNDDGINVYVIAKDDGDIGNIIKDADDTKNNKENDHSGNDDNCDDNKTNDDNDINDDHNEDNNDDNTITFIALDANPQISLDTNKYDVNLTPQGILNYIYYNTNSNQKHDFELVNKNIQEQQTPQETWDLKFLNNEYMVDYKNDVISQELLNNINNYLKIRSNIAKSIDSLQQKQQQMDVDFRLAISADYKENTYKFYHDIIDASKTLDDLKKDTMELQNLQVNMFMHNFLKDVV